MALSMQLLTAVQVAAVSLLPAMLHNLLTARKQLQLALLLQTAL